MDEVEGEETVDLIHIGVTSVMQRERHAMTETLMYPHTNQK